MKPSQVIKTGMVLAAVGLFGFVGFRVATAPESFTYRINFDTLPASDEAFQSWLASQPGVTFASVTRIGDAVIVVYEMLWYSNAPRLDPIAEARRFGYSGYWRSTCIQKIRW